MAGGRPQAEIDWEKVEELLIAGCMGTGIAHYLGIRPETLYLRCVEDKGLQFSEFSRQKKEKGDEILRAHQYAKALGLTDKGDNTLLIWLGKTRLKQMDYSQIAAAEAGRASYNFKLDSNGLGAGISPETLSNKANQSPESGNKESGLGST